MKHKKLQSYIFAGGQNRRMQGNHKAFLEFDGKKAIDILVYSLQDYGFDSITIVTDKQSLFDGFQHGAVIEDSIPDKGPMGALYTALTDTKTELILCLPCDMSFIDAELIEGITARAETEPADCTVTVSSRGIEPLLAVYHTRLRQSIREAIESDRLSLTKFVQSAGSAYFDIRGSGIELHNINTPGDYMRAARSITAKNILNKVCPNDGID
ncbi:molybdenum cofactor guanylyltransferase [bacterium]|nr:molybdenum cofactor guanylyltransferase [bacterium]